MSKRLLARAAALTTGAALAAGALVAVASPALAAPLGTVNLSKTSGLVTDNPMFGTATTSAPCPATYGEEAALRIGPAETGPFTNLTPSLGGGGYDQAPVVANPNRSFQTALGSAPANGRWWIVVECFSLLNGRHPDRFVTEIVVSGNQWKVPVVEATTTSLAVTPAGPVAAGTPVTLTATVAPSGAAGTVEFLRGTNSLGTAAVSGGAATLTTSTIPAGSWSLTARFTPADPSSFGASTSSAVSLAVSGPAGGVSKAQTITADVDPGAFTLDIAQPPSVALAGGQVGGTATGALKQATVTDLRGTNVGWDVTGQLTDFTGAGNIPAGNLSWTPSAAKASGSGAVTAGTAANLGDTRTLCTSAAGSSAGKFTCDAGLSLSIPDSVPPGAYTATLTLTLA
ncbi:Ig-like domain repeat protein [Micromonospora narathiwatensis]|uniref:Ig-like domain (Group 3) n=1 Tax=Micromonospora narathiwatensis TaxID=299146 RepID=A0A1A9ACL9_9ACTN|nr:Ig-like domain repeat protein [Micromonospora narathiwatensis]SBT53907.1 Ig-like domain (group 3) [Micromonospora narathiwatensis]